MWANESMDERIDRQTHDEADIRFSQFRETPDKYSQLQNSIIRHIWIY